MRQALRTRASLCRRPSTSSSLAQSICKRPGHGSTRAYSSSIFQSSAADWASRRLPTGTHRQSSPTSPMTMLSQSFETSSPAQIRAGVREAPTSPFASLSAVYNEDHAQVRMPVHRSLVDDSTSKNHLLPIPSRHLRISHDGEDRDAVCFRFRVFS